MSMSQFKDLSSFSPCVFNVVMHNLCYINIHCIFFDCASKKGAVYIHFFLVFFQTFNFLLSIGVWLINKERCDSSRWTAKGLSPTWT